MGGGDKQNQVAFSQDFCWGGKKTKKLYELNVRNDCRSTSSDYSVLESPPYEKQNERYGEGDEEKTVEISECGYSSIFLTVMGLGRVCRGERSSPRESRLITIQHILLLQYKQDFQISIKSSDSCVINEREWDFLELRGGGLHQEG